MKKLFIILLVISLANNAIAQVNLQTGSATFSLPMFNWQDDKSRLNAIVELNYNSGNGLKVNEVASNVGQGWRLIAGGVISRMQVGEPDDQRPRDVADLTKYPPGYLYDSSSPYDGCPVALTRYPIYKDKNHLYKQHNSVAADRELDRFSFQFNGKSGIFVLSKNYYEEGFFLGDNNMMVHFERDESMINQGVRTTISAFYITDENGLIYKFSEHELTRVLKVSYCNPDLQIAYTQPTFKDGNVYHEASFEDPTVVNPYIINSWYLTEISDPLTTRKITFHYPYLRNIDAPSGTTFSFYREKNYSIISRARSVTTTPALGSIDFPDNHHVVLNYGKQRVDLPGDLAIASIDITYRNRFLAKYELSTSYFMLNRYGTPYSDYQKQVARLCLQSVRKTGVDLKADEPPYLFDYYLGSGEPDDFIPPPFYHLKDIWGYYNGNNAITYENSINSSNTPIDFTKPLSDLQNNDIIGLCFITYGDNAVVQNSKPGYAKNGLLKRITYPTGGSLNYEYLQNEAFLEDQNKIVGGVHVSSTKVTDGGYSNGCDNPMLTYYNFSTDSTNSRSSLWALEKPLNSIVTSSHYSPEDKYFYYRPVLSFGCDYHFQYPGILSREQGISLTSTQQFLMTLSKVLDVVGGILTIVDAVSLCVSATPAAIVAVILDAIASITAIAITCTASLGKDETQHIYYDSDIYGSNPLPAQFKRVEVKEGPGGNGKSVIEFTSSDVYAIWEQRNIALSTKQRFAYWAYGLVKKKTVFDSTGSIVSQTENEYDFTKSKRTIYHHFTRDGRFASCKCLVIKTSSQRSTNWEDPRVYKAPGSYLTSSDDNAGLQVEIYQAYTGRVELKKTYDRVFKAGSLADFLETTAVYSYNENNYQVSDIVITQSNGDQTKKTIAYSGDYNTGILATLSLQHIITIPVSTTTSILRKGTSDWRYLGETSTEFITVGNGDIKPSKIVERRFNQPQSILYYSFYNDNYQSSHLSNYKTTQTFTYDATGNLTGVKDEGNRTVSNIYDYDDKYVVASVINADPNLDKPAYTSFETESLGGWLVNGSANFVSNNSVTGKRSFNLSSSNNLSAGINSDKPYILSFWTSNNSVTVGSNATLKKSAPVVNGFTFYEYIVPQGVSRVAISGNATIDELRLYPQSSRMRTVAYDPLIGKIAECDENNRVTYYEYDNLARLWIIKDENRNILKMYEYNYAISSSPCTATYTSNAI
ncbi:MAG: hypothetical protein ABIN89_02790 [Chitinophagaceae bacterium]